MKELIKKDKVKDFLKNNGIFIIFCLIMLWISLLLIQVADGYTMLDPNNTKPTQMLIPLFGQTFGNTASTLTIVGIILYCIFFVVTNKKEIDISKMFLIIVVPISLIHLTLHPIGRVPDENTHIRRAYEISYGYILTDVSEEGIVGRELPAELKFVTNENQTYDLYEQNKEKDYGTEKEFLDFNNTAIYAFISYLPQAIGIFITRIFGANIVVQVYGARVVNLFTYILLTYFAIKKIPFKRLAIFLIAFLPITIQEAASVSPDALTNGICFFFVSYILHLIYSKEKASKKDLILLGITSAVVALVKIIYLPLCALVFLIPDEKFENIKKKYTILILLFIISVILNLGWLKYANSHYRQAYNEANPNEQIAFVLQDPYRYIITCFRDVHLRIDFYLQGLVGADLSHLDIDMSMIMQVTLFLLLVFSFVCDENENIKPNWKIKSFLALIFLAVIALLFTSEYIAWNPVGNFWVNGIQPRYFIPVLIIVSVLCNMNNIKLEKKLDYKYIYMLTIGVNLHAIITMMNLYMK